MTFALGLGIFGVVLLYSGFKNLTFAQAVKGDTQSQPSSASTLALVALGGSGGNAPETSPDLTPGVSGGKVIVSPNANRKGVGIAPLVTNFVSDVAGLVGNPLTIGTGTNHNRLTTDGNVSDHWDGHAADIPVPVDSKTGDQIARAALVLAGVNANQAARMVQTGGLWTLHPNTGPYKGKRVQIIWKTNQGGDHHNHVHIGVR